MVHRKVDEKDWSDFTRNFRPSREDTEHMPPSDAAKSLLVADLAEIWKALQYCDRLEEIADVHRGIEWNKPLRKDGEETGNRGKLVKHKREPGFEPGIPPQAKPFYAFSPPPPAFLSVSHEDRLYSAFRFALGQTQGVSELRKKVPQRSRLAATADFTGLLCYQTFTAIWPHNPELTVPLAAVLNGPVANAFLAMREIRHNRNASVKKIPLPHLANLDVPGLNALVGGYQQETSDSARDLILRHIDATVLSAYDLPPRLERHLLDYFNGSRRQVPFQFANYFPDDFRPWFSLGDYLSDQFKHATAGNFVKDCAETPEVFRDAVKSAGRLFGEGEAD